LFRAHESKKENPVLDKREDSRWMTEEDKEAIHHVLVLPHS